MKETWEPVILSKDHMVLWPTLERLLSIKGLGDVKILRIAAALAIARRAAGEIIRGRKDEAKQAP